MVSCQKCHLVRTYPFPQEQSEEDNYFLNEEDYNYRTNNLEIWHKFSDELIAIGKKYQKSGAWLDVGTNIGILVADALQAGYNAYGTDISQKSIAAGKKLFNLNDRLFVTSLEDANLPLKFEMISYYHVLEHIRNLDRELKAVQANLRDQGLLIIFVPNFNSLWRRVLRNKWRGLMPTQHHWQFEEKTLKNILEENNFVVLEISKKNITYKIDFSFEGAIKAILLVISKIFNWGDNLVVVARKK